MPGPLVWVEGRPGCFVGVGFDGVGRSVCILGFGF